MWNIHIYYLIQTLDTLNLEKHNVGTKRMKLLANTLQNNTVRLIYYSSVSYKSLSSDKDTYYAES
jgi:hypothetical protein